MKKCTNCNKEYDEGTEFCPTCGLRLVSGEAEQSAQAAPQYTPPVQQPVLPAQNFYAVPQMQPQAQASDPVTVGEWMIMLVNFIPCVGSLIFFIIMLIWAFGSNVKPSKQTYAKASLIIWLVSLGLVLFFWVILGVLGASFIDVIDEIMYELS